jgi:hypothetical protein
MATQTSKPKKGEASAKDWDAIRAMFMRGETLDYIMNSLPHITITKKTIMNRMSKEGLVASKRAIENKAIAHITERVEQEKIAVNNKCIQLFNDGSEVIQKLLNEYNAEIAIGNVPKNAARATAYNIDMLMSGVTKIQKGLRVAYGMDETGKLYEKEPEVLVIEGLSMEKI